MISGHSDQNLLLGGPPGTGKTLLARAIPSILPRARGTTVFPARFMLVGAMNPCPCGYAGDPTRGCTCQQGAVERYQKRLSGPLMDRSDLHVDVPRVEYDKLAADMLAESSAVA